jgi:hypothetical protein
VGMIPDGEILKTYRSPRVPGRNEENEESFGRWKDQDPLPAYQDHITGFKFVSPSDSTSESTPEKPSTYMAETSSIASSVWPAVSGWSCSALVGSGNN